jgi:hypothetical protein
MGEEEAVASTLGVVAHRLVGLALVGDEGEREFLVGVERLLLAHLRRRWLEKRPRLIVRTSHRGVVEIGVGGLGGGDQGGEGSEEGKQGHRRHQHPLLPGKGLPTSGPRPCKDLCASSSASYDTRNN